MSSVTCTNSLYLMEVITLSSLCQSSSSLCVFPGQGVVMNKSVFSDFVYMEAMCNSGFVSRGGEYDHTAWRLQCSFSCAYYIYGGPKGPIHLLKMN